MDYLIIFWLLLALIWGLGILSAVNAIMTARTSQGAIGWAVSLLTFPYISLPLYWLFGQRKFYGYVKARRLGNLKINHLAAQLNNEFLVDNKIAFDSQVADYLVLEKLVSMPFTGHNNVELLTNGEQTFQSIFQALENATEYILIQFYTVNSDHIGNKLKNILVACAKRGIKIYFLYDEIGSYRLKATYAQELMLAGVQIHRFKTTRGRRRRFQINFRNHRKIVVVDGYYAFVGGHNIGDEYLGLDPQIGTWRDTHLKLEGPSVQCIQLSFVEDWYWATNEIPDLQWQPHKCEQQKNVLVLPTGPADVFETCGLFFIHAINTSKTRLWIISPYFVPDEQVLAALYVAALRGVDVRIMLPEKSDNMLVDLSSYSYFEDMERSNIKIYRYQSAFLHQKVMLIDDEVVGIGTANLDNRSFRLNFEIIILVIDKSFARIVETMLINDFENCRPINVDEITRRKYWSRLASRVARLMSPIQ